MLNRKILFILLVCIIVYCIINKKNDTYAEGFVSTKNNYKAYYRRNKREILNNARKTFNKYTSGVYYFFVTKK